MSTGVTSKQLQGLQRMTDAEFANVLLVLASIPFGGAGGGSGFFARFATTKAAKYISTTAIKQFLVRVVADLFAVAVTAAVGGALNSDVIKTQILLEIFKHTGLELETLDIEGGKKAVGKLIADSINTKYGTSFTPFYPPENIIEQVKQELLSEVLEVVE